MAFLKFNQITARSGLSLIGVMVLVFGLFIAVIGSQQEQDTRSKASTVGNCGDAEPTGDIISRNVPVTASAANENLASWVVDGNLPNGWNAGNYAPQWIELNLGSKKTVGGMKLYTAQIPDGQTVHQILTGANPNPSTVSKVLNCFTVNDQLLNITFDPPLTNTQYIRVSTTQSPSWVAWQEIEVFKPANQSPTANAGANKTVTLPIPPNNPVTLVGTGTDPDGTITGYSWTKNDGPTGGTIATPNAGTTAITGLVEGVYEFQLEVTDNEGAKATDTITVTVNRAPNVGPTANAGPDKTIVLPTNSVTLAGSATDSDGTIADYLWTKQSGPTDGYIEEPYNASTVVRDLVQGTYEFKLDVVDNEGVHGFDTVKVIVSPAPPTNLTFDLFLHGVGKAGDSANPTGQGNMNLTRLQRLTTVDVFDAQNQLVLTEEGVLTFNSTSGSFKGTINMGTQLVNGVYLVKVKFAQSLKTQIPGIQIITPGATNLMPVTTMINGDVNNDNSVNILDYDILLGCYSDFQAAENCTPEKKIQSDITDDGFVNQFDYNLFVRELSSVGGQ